MSRRLIYLCMIAGLLMLVALGALSSRHRNGFLGEYSRNLRRVVAGEWRPLQEPRSSRAPIRQRARGRGYRTEQIFRRLDRDQDHQLDADELGRQLTARSSSPPPLDLPRFQQLLDQGWLPQPNTDERSSTLADSDTRDEPRTSRSLAIEPAVGAKSELSAEPLFDPTHVVRVDIELDELAWQQLCHQSRSHHAAFRDPLDKPYTYFSGTVTIDGVTIPHVGIRKKGFIGSQDTVRPSLKIKFDEFVPQAPIEGLDRLTLNNNKQDRSLISQSLTYTLFRQAGLPAPRSNFATVFVNGQYLGVYSHVESVKKPYLRQRFGNEKTRVYEGTLTDFYPKSIEWFEPKTGPSRNDRQRISALAETLDDPNSTLDDIAKLVDLDSFLRYWALEMLINFWDGYNQNQNNYFVVQNPQNDRLVFIPWGADSCFGERPHFVRRRGENSEAVRATSILSNRLYHFEGIPSRYRTIMLGLLDDVWQEAELLREIDRIEDLLRDYLDVHQVQSVLAADEVRRFIQGRREVILAELHDNWPPPVAQTPRIPQYREPIGAITGQFQQLPDGSYRPQASMLFRGETFPMDIMTVAPTLDAAMQIQLNFPAQPQPFAIRLTCLDSPTSSELRATGRLDDFGNSLVEVRGKLLHVVRAADEFPRSGQFELTITERRGRRW